MVKCKRVFACIYYFCFVKLFFFVNNFIQNTIQNAEQTGFIQTILGRKRPILNINSKNKVEKSAAERIAINSPV